MPIDLPPKVDIWLPPKPAIIRRLNREAARKGTFPFPVFLPSGPAVLSSLSIQNSGGTSEGAGGITFSGVNAGDLLLVWDVSRGDSDGVTMAGFTSLATLGSSTSVRLLYKVAAGGEGFIAGQGGGFEVKRWFQLRGNRPITSVTAQSPFSSQQTNNAPSNQTVTVSSFSEIVVVIGAYAAAGNAINPAGFSPAADSTLNLNSYAVLAVKIYASSPANTTISMTDEGSGNTLVSGYLRLS